MSIIDRTGGAPASLFARGGTPREPARTGGIRLLDADPDFGAALAPADLDEAREHLVVPAMEVPGGRWTPDPQLSRQLGVLVVRGRIVCDGQALGRPDLQLFGPGDVIDPRLFDRPDSTWRVLIDARLAVLDGRITVAARRWPGLVPGLARRLLDGREEQHLLAAIAVLPRVEDRLLALLDHLANRWGTVTLDGLVLDLPLTHETLGRVIGARRPTVSLAITELTATGRLARLGDGRWVLPLGDAAVRGTAEPHLQAV